MITLQTGAAIAGTAANNNTVTVTITGMQLNAGVETYEMLSQGSLLTTGANLYTAPASTTSFIKRIFMANVTGSVQSGIQLFLSSTGAAANNNTAITSVFSIPANGTALYDESGWTMYDANMSVYTNNPIGSRFKSRTIINPGTTTYTVPSGISSIFVECIGPGGGGGGANATAAANSAFAQGGGAGGYACKLITPASGNYAVVVGVGGGGGNNAAAGNAGNVATTFNNAGTFITANPGNGGNFMAGTASTVTYVAIGGGGGTASNGDVNVTGEAGFGSIRASNIAGVGGFGGSSMLGAGGGGGNQGANGTASAGNAGTGNGAGGGGAAVCGIAGTNGGNGSNGIIVVSEFA